MNAQLSTIVVTPFATELVSTSSLAITQAQHVANRNECPCGVWARDGWFTVCELAPETIEPDPELVGLAACCHRGAGYMGMSAAALFWEAVMLMWLVLWVGLVMLMWLVLWVGFAGAWLWYRRPSRWAWRVWWRRVQSPPSGGGVVRLPPAWTARAAKGGAWQRQRLDNVIRMSERRR